MDERPKYYIVTADALPEILHRVMDAKKGLICGRYKSVNDAAEALGISRSAYYKYRDALRPFYDIPGDRIITFYLVLEDEPGVLSCVINLFADAGANILTVNQSIPINGQATVTITARTGKMNCSLEEMLGRGLRADGIVRFEILAGE